MQNQTATIGECVWNEEVPNANVKIFKFKNGEHKGIVNIQTPKMENPMVLETQPADDLPQARAFAYFILHEMTEYT